MQEAVFKMLIDDVFYQFVEGKALLEQPIVILFL